MSDIQWPAFLKGVSPSRVFWIFALTHLVVWTIATTLSSPNAPLDVIEGYVWGREWLIGTYKHPPMQAWWLESLAWLTGRVAWAHFFASQLSVVIAFWAVWKTGQRIVGEIPALMGAMLLEGIIYYNFTSAEFNPDVLQLPFWALIGLFYHRSIKDNRMIDWLLLGVWSAGGLYSKYSTVLLLVVLFILTLARPEGRRRLKTFGPYLTIAVTSLLFLPHLMWLFDNNFLPYTYAESRMRHPTPPGIVRSAIIIPSLFLSSQFLAAMPALLILIAFTGRRLPSPKKGLNGFDREFLAAVTFGPCFLVLLMSMIFGYNVHDMWGTPFWNFLGLWALSNFRLASTPEAMTRFMFSIMIVFVMTLLVYTGGNTLYPYMTGRVGRVHFPGKLLTEKTTEGWHKMTKAPLRYVIGDTWPAGNIAYYAPERPHVLIDGDTGISPWINPQDVKRDGAIIVWCVTRCNAGSGNYVTNLGVPTLPDFLKNYPRAKVQPPLELPRQTGAKVLPAVLGWAILPPS